MEENFWDELDDHWQEEAKKEAEEEARKSGEFNLLPEGTYNLQVKDWTIMRSKKKGTPGLNMEFIVVDGKYKNRKQWHTFWLTKNNLAFVGRDLHYLTGRFFTQFSELKTFDFKGLYVTAKTKHEEYEGKVNSKIAYFSTVLDKKKEEVKPTATASHEDDPF